MADRELDLRGLNCPLPVLRARKTLSAMTPGSRLAVLADDPKAPSDFEAWCGESGHRLLESADGADGHRFLIERG